MNRRYIIYTLTLISSLIYAIVVLLDAFIVISLKYDIVSVSLAFFLVGSTTAPLIVGLSYIPVGKKNVGSIIDPLFKGLRIPNRKELMYILIASLGNAVFSLLYFFMLRAYRDPSAMLAFISLVPVYLIFADILLTNERPTMIEVQGISMIATGVILVSLTVAKLDIIGLLIVLIPMNLFIVIHNVGMKKLEESELLMERMDGISVRFWLIIFTTIMIYLLSLIMFGFDVVISSITASLEGFLPLFVDMSLTFVSYALYIRALAYGKMSEVNALYSTNTIFALLLQLVLSWYLPEIYSLPLTQADLLMKALGITVASVGVASLALSEVVAYVFIRASPGAGKLLDKLINIRGVETVSVTAGTYDYILRIRIRSLGQAYYIVTRELDKIDGILDYKWVTTLKEWEVF